MMEPNAMLRWVRSMEGTRLHSDVEAVEALYVASYQRLVSVVGAVAQDRQEAEEAGGEVGSFVALASIALASYVGVATDSPVVLVAIAVVVLWAVLYLVRHGRLLRRDRARGAEDRQQRREALGVPDGSQGDER